MAGDGLGAGRPRAELGPASWAARAGAHQKLAQGIRKVCSLQDFGSVGRLSDAEADAFKALRLGLLAVRKHADLLDGYVEEEITLVLGLVLVRGTRHRFFKGQAKECLEILISRPLWLHVIRSDREHVAAARSLGLHVREADFADAGDSERDSEDEEPDGAEDEAREPLIPVARGSSGPGAAASSAGPQCAERPQDVARESWMDFCSSLEEEEAHDLSWLSGCGAALPSEAVFADRSDKSRALARGATLDSDEEEMAAAGRRCSFQPTDYLDGGSVVPSSAVVDLERTVADLRRFMVSPAGQDLIFRTHECFLYIQSMAAWCRARSRYGHGSIRTLSSLTSAGAAGTVVVGGIIVAASGGIATPAVVGAITGGLIAGAVSGGVSLANSFAALGLDMLEARFVKARIEELRARIEMWDEYLRAALEAADNVAHGPHALSIFARAVGDYGMKASSIMTIASAIIKVNAARYDYMAVAAPQALGGMIKAGTPLAQSLMISLSGVGLICGLVDAVSAGFEMWSGYCDAADSLDMHADRFCAMLRMMRETAHETDAQKALAGQLPWLLLLELMQCRVPPPDYRVFDYARQMMKRIPKSRNDRQGKAYFQVTIGTRRSNTGDALVRLKPYRWTPVNRAVLLRLLPGDEPLVSVQGFDKRGLQSLMRGDPPMGGKVTLHLRDDGESRILAQSRDRTASMRVRYQVVRSGLSTLSRRFSRTGDTPGASSSSLGTRPG